MLTASLFADGGAEVGLGHFRRSLTLALAMKARGVEVGMFVPDESLAAEVRSLGLSSAVVARDGGDFPLADIIIADGYGIASEAAEKWKECGGLTAIIDDNAVRPIHVHTVINPNLYGAALDYTAYQAEKLLLGPDYALIDPAFPAVRKSKALDTESATKDILVWFGGTDEGAYATAVARALLPLCQRRIHVVVSPLRLPSAEVRALAEENPQRIVFHHGAKLAELMRHSEIYVGAAGTSVAEAIAAELSVAVFCLAENQQSNARYLQQHGAVVMHSFNPGELAAKALNATQLKELASSLDGRGAERISDSLISIFARKKV